MKILRFILFIPAFLVAGFLASYLVELFFKLIDLIYSIDKSPFSFIWDGFILSGLTSVSAISIGLIVYPLDKKKLPLIILSLFYVFIGVYMFNSFQAINELVKLEGREVLSLIASGVGALSGIIFSWYTHYSDES